MARKYTVEKDDEFEFSYEFIDYIVDRMHAEFNAEVKKMRENFEEFGDSEEETEFEEHVRMYENGWFDAMQTMFVEIKRKQSR